MLLVKICNNLFWNSNLLAKLHLPEIHLLKRNFSYYSINWNSRRPNSLIYLAERDLLLFQRKIVDT